MCFARLEGPRTSSRTTIANLDGSFVENALVFIEPNIGSKVLRGFFLLEQALDMKAKWGDRASSVTEILKDVEQVLNVFKKLKEESLQILLDEAFMDIEVFFSEILSPEWMGSTTSGEFTNSI